MVGKKYLGFDIGLSGIKLAYFSKGICGVKCELLDFIPFKDVDFYDLEIAIREYRIFDAIMKVMDLVNYKGRKIVIPLPGDTTRVFLIRDAGEREDDDYKGIVQEFASRIFDGIIPIGLEVTWHVLSRKNGKVDIIGVLYNSSVVEGFREFFSAYTDRFEIEPAPVSLYNLYSLLVPTFRNDNKHKLLLHLGVRDVVICIVSRDGDLLCGRTRSELNVLPDEGLTLEKVAPYLEEVTRAFKDFMYKVCFEECDDLSDFDIYITGGPAISSVLVEAFEVVLRLKVKPFNFLTNFPFKVYKGVPIDIAPRFALAVGAVISRI